MATKVFRRHFRVKKWHRKLFVPFSGGDETFVAIFEWHRAISSPFSIGDENLSPLSAIVAIGVCENLIGKFNGL
jgi:hypothetical protein